MPLTLLRALALACLAVALVASPAAAKPADPPQPAAAAWILIDARDGERLAAHDATSQRSIASTTKLMTAYLALREKNLDKRVTAPGYQALAAESLLGLEEGERISYRELLYALILASANDGAVTVAQGVSGSEDRFVEKMNATAERLGLDDTSYANPIGLDEAGNYSTAADLASWRRSCWRTTSSARWPTPRPTRLRPTAPRARSSPATTCSPASRG